MSTLQVVPADRIFGVHVSTTTSPVTSSYHDLLRANDTQEHADEEAVSGGEMTMSLVPRRMDQADSTIHPF